MDDCMHVHYFSCKDPPNVALMRLSAPIQNKPEKTIKNLFGLFGRKSVPLEESKINFEDRIASLWKDYSS